MWKRVSITIVIIALLIGGYLLTNPQSSLFPRWDVNEDGIVDIADLAIVSSHFGEVTTPAQAVLVVRVIDGDTIELADGTPLRYIGIDTPEDDEPLYHESVEANRNLVEGKQVRLEYDKQMQDIHSRTLAYVYTNGAFVNCELLRLGVAEIATYQQTLKYLDSLIECQQEALKNRRGIWEGVLDEDIVYITATGDKYHLDGCRYLKKSAIPTTKEKAIKKGYTPCSICNP